jgi:hypothetical protein
VKQSQSRNIIERKKIALYKTLCLQFAIVSFSLYFFTLYQIQTKMGLFSKSKSPTPSYQSGPPAYSAKPSNNNYAPPSPPRQQQPMNPDTRSLPNGWISQYDPNSMRFFYVYTPSGLRQWEHPADKSDSSRGENSSYMNQPQQQQPYYGQQPQQQRYNPQQQQPYYQQQPQIVQQQQPSRFGGFGGGGGGAGKLAAAGLGGGLLGFMAGDLIGQSERPEIIENNYYDGGNDYNQNDNFGDGGYDDGGGFDMF